MFSTKALINQLRVPDAIETDVRFVDRAEPSHHRFGMTRMEGLRISYEQKMSQAGRTEDGRASRKRDVAGTQFRFLWTISDRGAAVRIMRAYVCARSFSPARRGRWRQVL